MAAAVTTLMAYALAFILTLRYSTKFFKFDSIFILKSVTASTIMSVVIILLNPNDLMSIVISVIISIVVYFALILVFKGIKTEEFQLFKEMFRKT